jgi:hypothetical protein
MHHPGPDELEALLPAEWLEHPSSAAPVVEVTAEAVA